MSDETVGSIRSAYAHFFKEPPNMRREGELYTWSANTDLFLDYRIRLAIPCCVLESRGNDQRRYLITPRCTLSAAF